MKCPCEDCICLAMCIAKKYFSLIIRDCSLIYPYLHNANSNHYIDDRVLEANKYLRRNWEIRVGSYGYEFLGDPDSDVKIRGIKRIKFPEMKVATRVQYPL